MDRGTQKTMTICVSMTSATAHALLFLVTDEERRGEDKIPVERFNVRV